MTGGLGDRQKPTDGQKPKVGQAWAHHSTGIYEITGRDRYGLTLRRMRDRQVFAGVHFDYFLENFSLVHRSLDEVLSSAGGEAARGDE